MKPREWTLYFDANGLPTKVVPRGHEDDHKWAETDQACHVLEATPRTLVAEEMLQVLQDFNKELCGCEPGGGVTDLEPGHTCGVCALVARATGEGEKT